MGLKYSYTGQESVSRDGDAGEMHRGVTDSLVGRL